MAVRFSGVLVLFLFVLGGLLALPVAQMFHAGIVCAREDTHRVTPQDPWVFFWRGARRSFRRIIFALLLLVIVGGLISWPQHPRHGNWIHTIHTASLPLAVGLSVLTTAALTGFLIAPRVRGRTALAATLLALTLVVLIGGEIGVALLIPEWAVTEYVYETSRAQGGTTMNHWIVPAFPFSYLALSTLLCWAAWRWAKGRGEQWFRFEG